MFATLNFRLGLEHSALSTTLNPLYIPGIKPGPPPPPAQCNTYKTKAVCPERCTWTDGKGCASPPPPPPPPGPCAPATQAECGVGTGPYTGAHVYCANACAWNGTKCIDRSPTGYPIPDNSSLVSLVGLGTPLSKNTTISFYGDSITCVCPCYQRRAIPSTHAVGPLGLRVAMNVCLCMVAYGSRLCVLPLFCTSIYRGHLKGGWICMKA